ncbi:DUF6074 family protein [Mesorhizobium sp. ZC-5]|uniref:DUF6074 family protein n=1 Tax=Mesorhizobium sp. ZC-5 TaxID=2986066 RepID=UPI0021E73795|nr:DUF6074 family protein [Mesorhizobium sp. ZC-5]MCV3241758.1 DUF6074 family protein [Mesorhizobium sp. ZC-5]
MGHSKLVAFPLHRRQKWVEGIARVLASKNGEEANVFWRNTAKEILGQLSAYGLETETAEQEIRMLLRTVLKEMGRRNVASSM